MNELMHDWGSWDSGENLGHCSLFFWRGGRIHKFGSHNRGHLMQKAADNLGRSIAVRANLPYNPPLDRGGS